MSWGKVTLGQFITVRNERFKPKDVSIASLKRIDKIDFSGKIFISEKPSNTDMILIKKGDLVISGINVEKGAMAIYTGNEDITATIHYSSYSFDENKIDIDFLKHFLKSLEFKEALKEQVPGGIKTEIKPKHLLPLLVNIPIDIKEQRAVVKILQQRNSKVDAISLEIEKQLAFAKKLRQKLIEEAIQGKLVKQNKKDIPAIELLKKIKSKKKKLIEEGKLKKEKELAEINTEEIPFEIPENWIWCRLGEITTLLTDGKHGDSKDQKDSGYYFLSAKDIQNGKFIYDNARQITFADFQETHRRTNLEPGDLCVVNTGATIGKTALAPENKLTRNTTFQKSVAVLKVLNEFTNMKFVEYFIINETPKLLKTSRGSAINNLLLGDMKNVLFAMPPIDEQNRIVEKIDELMQHCNDLENSIKQSESENEKLLQQVLREALRKEPVEA